MVKTIQQIEVDYHRQNYITLYAHQYDTGQQLDAYVYDNGDLVLLGESGVALTEVRVKINTPDGKSLMLNTTMPAYELVTMANVESYFTSNTDWAANAYYTDDYANYELAINKGYYFKDASGEIIDNTKEAINNKKIYYVNTASPNHYVTINTELNYIHIEFPQSVFLEDGQVECELVLISSKMLGTMHFTFLVDESVYDEDSALSDPATQTILQALIAETQGYSETCVKKAAEAEASATAAKTSETNAKTSETNAASSQSKAASSESNAKTSETNAKTSETNAATSETNTKTSETNAKTSETNANDWALYSQSYARGDAKKSDGTDYRSGQDTDNAKYYADKASEYAGQAAGLSYSSYKTWSEFETIMADPETKDYVSYCITEDFKTTSDFLIGAGVKYRSYSLVFRNASQKWVAFASPNAGGGGITVSDTEPEDMDVNTFWMSEYE